MVIMAVLGGIGTVLGPLWGAVILVPIAEITRAFWGGSLQGVHLIVYGAPLMVIILYAPQGVEGRVRQGWRALVRWLAAPGRRPIARAVAAAANRAGDRPARRGRCCPRARARRRRGARRLEPLRDLAPAASAAPSASAGLTLRVGPGRSSG